MTTYADRSAAATLTVLLNALFLSWLCALVAQSATPGLPETDGLQVTWVAPAPAKLTSLHTMSTYTVSRARRQVEPVAPSPIHDSTSDPPASHVMSDDHWSEVAPSKRNVHADITFEPRTFVTKPLSLDVQRLPTFDIRDSSVMGKLSRMGHSGVCRELRAALADRASRSAVDTIIRTMQANGCPIEAPLPTVRMPGHRIALCPLSFLRPCWH